ncbi:MAG: hypothetical protein AAFW70_10415, partial [Cyanobacteria bacterium J06635_10]
MQFIVKLQQRLKIYQFCDKPPACAKRSQPVSLQPLPSAFLLPRMNRQRRNSVMEIFNFRVCDGYDNLSTVT